jgi:hypothetical protein
MFSNRRFSIMGHGAFWSLEDDTHRSTVFSSAGYPVQDVRQVGFLHHASRLYQAWEMEGVLVGEIFLVPGNLDVGHVHSNWRTGQASQQYRP